MYPEEKLNNSDDEYHSQKDLNQKQFLHFSFKKNLLQINHSITLSTELFWNSL